MFDKGSMHDARGIANFFLDRAVQTQHPITVMTLLKVLYFAHAWHLAKYSAPLVAQPFEAWKHGPVNRVVYEQLKGNGPRQINSKLVSFDPISCQFTETICNLELETINFLTNIFDYYSQFHPFKLSDLTHEEGSPWDIIWNEAEKRAVPGMIIPDSLIMEWFRKGGDDRAKRMRRGDST